MTIENHSGKTLRINYDEFKLVGSNGFAYAAIPPMQAQGVASRAPRQTIDGAILLASYQQANTNSVQSNPGQVSQRQVIAVPVPVQIRHDRFFVAPHFAWYYPGWIAWDGPFPYDPLYYNRFYAYWPEHVPTKDMLAQALPAGVLQEGGRVSGFVYFQEIADRETRVNFEMDLVDATSGQAFGHVTIPFEVKK